MIIITKKYFSTLLVLLFTACLCSPLYADEHSGGHNHGGNYNHDGNYHHGNYDNNYNYYGGNNHGWGGVGVYIGPGYYPYGPYYYPNHYVIVTPSNSSAPTHHTHSTQPKAVVIQAQTALTSRGYYDGSVDGIAGSHTTSAIEAFQHDNGLAENGLLDDATLKALGISKD